MGSEPSSIIGLAPQSSSFESAHRVLRVLEAFGAAQTDLSLTELAGRLDLPKSSVHRLLAVLLDAGFVEQHSVTKRYRLGMRLFEIGSTVIHRRGLHEAAHPVLEELAVSTGETCHLAVLSGAEVVYVYKIDGTSSFHMSSRVGGRAPCYCTSIGKVLMAWGGDELLRRVVWAGLHPHTHHTITREAELVVELERVRSQGYALDREELQEGLRCIAAPIRDHSGRVVASVGVAAPAQRLPDPEIPRSVDLVVKAAGAISRNLGYLHDGRMAMRPSQS